MSEITISCPFCGEDDFDLIGLKDHLEMYCKIYNETPSVHRIFQNEIDKTGE